MFVYEKRFDFKGGLNEIYPHLVYLLMFVLYIISTCLLRKFGRLID